MHQIANDIYTSSHSFRLHEGQRWWCQISSHYKGILPVLYIVTWMASSCEVSIRWASEGFMHIQSLLQGILSSKTDSDSDSDHRILVGEDAEVLVEVWSGLSFFFMDLSPTAAGDRVAVIVKKHCGRMCPLKWCSPGYKRRAPSQAARRPSCAPCWIWREPACYPGRPGTGQGEAAHCSQPQTPPEKTNHSSSVTTGIYTSCFILNGWTIPMFVATL